MPIKATQLKCKTDTSVQTNLPSHSMKVYELLKKIYEDLFMKLWGHTVLQLAFLPHSAA